MSESDCRFGGIEENNNNIFIHMPKKHRSTNYTKPPSTLPSSLSSTHNVASSKNAPSSVNDLLSSLRKSTKSQYERNNQPPQPRTMPPAIRQLLQLSDTPGPRPRMPRRIDEHGHRLPAGPAPPSSWLASSRSASGKSGVWRELGDRKYPENILHLPGVKMPKGLLHLCLKKISSDWAFQSQYNMYYFATMPTVLRVLLLSYIAVHGPPEGEWIRNAFHDQISHN